MKFIYNMKNTVYTITLLYIGRFVYDQINNQLEKNIFFDIKNIIFWCSLLIILLFFIILFVLLEKYIIKNIYEKNVILNLFYVCLLSTGSYYLLNIVIPLIEDLFNITEVAKPKVTIDYNENVIDNTEILEKTVTESKSKEIKDDVFKETENEAALKEIVKDNFSKEILKSNELKDNIINEVKKEELLKEEPPKVRPKRDILDRETMARRESRPMVGWWPDFDDQEECDAELEIIYDTLYRFFPFLKDLGIPNEVIVDADENAEDQNENENENEDNQNIVYYLVTGAINIIRYSFWPLFGSPKRKKVKVKDIKDIKNN